ncbi:MAG: hypothetical protein ACOCVM_03035 [Desulfovibrionaceae bacterium]
MSSECIGCGWCCLDNPCEASHRLYGYLPRCPELFWSEESHRYLCALMLDEERGAGFRYELMSGVGCCAPLNPFRQDVRNRDND